MRSAVLCYNLKGTEKGKKIGMIFGFLKEPKKGKRSG